MHSLKRTFFKTIILLLILTSGWFYYEYRKSQNTLQIQAEISSGNYQAILDRFAKLTPRKVARGKYGDGYYKALALEKMERSTEAAPYWEAVLQNAVSISDRAHASYYLGKHAVSQGNTDQAMDYFNRRELQSSSVAVYGSAKLSLASLLIDTGKLQEAKNLLQNLAQQLPTGEILVEVKQILGDLNTRMTFSRRVFDNSIDYVIRPGDSLAIIAKKFNTTVELIQEMNNLSHSVIRPNNHLKILTSTFSIVISKKNNTLTLFEDGRFFKEYRVGTGKDNTTPEGQFEVTGKQPNPTWYRPDGAVVPYGHPDNFLGTRWISINYPGYGIHGTWEDDTIGYQSSAGCIRLLNKEVEELFKLISTGTPVLITD